MKNQGRLLLGTVEDSDEDGVSSLGSTQARSTISTTSTTTTSSSTNTTPTSSSYY